MNYHVCSETGSGAEFQDLINRINEIINDEPIPTDDIPKILAQAGLGHPCNCYPGIPGAGCHDVVFSFSLVSSSRIQGRHRIWFKEAVHKLIQHVQGICPNTRAAVLVVDNWDCAAFDDWKPNLDAIARQCRLECYLLAGGCVAKVYP